MAGIKKFNEFFSIKEAVILNKDYTELIHELSELVHTKKYDKDELLSAVIEIGDKYGVCFMDYDTFHNVLSEVDKKNAPPKGRVPFFGFYDSKSKKPCIVFDVMPVAAILKFELKMIEEMLEHESVHTQQDERSAVEYKLPNVNPSTQRSLYFSDKNEIMAFSQSIARDLYRRKSTLSDMEKNLEYNRLYNDISHSVDDVVLKRYHKYIYMYLSEYLDKKN